MTDRRVPGNEEVITAVHDTLDAHVEEYHAFKADDLKVMVNEHRELYDEVAPLARDTNTKVNLLVTEIYGQPAPTAADPFHREGGMVELLTEMNTSIKLFSAQAANGGIPTHRKWTTGQWTFYGTIGAAFITMAVSVSIALLGG